MRIGLDFDNTLAGYDEVFASCAHDMGLGCPPPPCGKAEVRDHVRETHGEIAWQRLQAAVYGPRMPEARPVPGAFAFVRRCREAGHELVIVSHKTRFAAQDEHGVDLRAASLDWMRAHDFFTIQGLGFAPSDVYFESTRREKVARINALACDLFVDDLPEVLCHEDLSPSVRRVLLGVSVRCPVEFAGTWEEIHRHVFG